MFDTPLTYGLVGSHLIIKKSFLSLILSLFSFFILKTKKGQNPLIVFYLLRSTQRSCYGFFLRSVHTIYFFSLEIPPEKGPKSPVKVLSSESVGYRSPQLYKVILFFNCNKYLSGSIKKGNRHQNG